MKSKHVVFAAFLVLSSLFIAAGKASAQSCTTQYGGDVTCVATDLTLNKQVAQPATDSKGSVTASSTFVENLSVTQPLLPGNEALFRLTVKNTGDQTMNTVTVKDVLPPYLTFVSGPGSFDTANRTLTIMLENLTPGESRTVEVLARVVDAAQFATNANTFCANNYAEARAMDRFDEDTAQVCFAAAENLPVAGFNDLFLLLPFAGVGLTGLALLKKRG